MNKILKIEDAKNIVENGKEITRYIFNNDKIVRIETKTDKILTKNVPETYLNLISIYSTRVDNEKKKAKKQSIEQKEKEIIDMIKSGKGAGLGVFLGFLLKLTAIGPIIAGFMAFDFLNLISDKESLVKYIEEKGVRSLNFKKGFYASVWFGWLVAWACCDQWKRDMISVLADDPIRTSRNKHLCFKFWFVLTLIIFILELCTGFFNSYNYPTSTTTTPSYYRTYKY